MRVQTGVPHATPHKPKKFYQALYFQVVVGLVIGILVGHFWPDVGAALKPLGDAFVKIVKMMIAPVVFCTIVSGITSLNDTREIGKTLVKSMGLFYALTILSLIVGLAAVMIIQPGAGMHISPASLDGSVAAKYATQAAPGGFVEFLIHIIPHSFFGAFLLRRLRRWRGAAGPADLHHRRLRPDPHRRCW
jgi:aerobic C4-dicarboxylate transport protein